MTPIEEAKVLFKDAGLSFPTIPEELALHLKKHDEWVYSTREIDTDPYDLSEFVCEFDEYPVEDYVLLAHSGHGVN